VEKDSAGEGETEREREEPEKKLAGGSYYEPGSRSHARASRPLGPANKSPLLPTTTTATATAAGWRLVPRDFSSANHDLRKKDLRGSAVLCLGQQDRRSDRRTREEGKRSPRPEHEKRPLM
jgi:hypothetical protein